MTHLLALLHRLGIKPSSESPPEPPQSPRLVLLHIEQLLTTRVPERTVLRVFRTSVDGLRGSGAVCEGAAVTERDELGEGVGPLGTAQEGGVADLLTEGAGMALRAE